METENTDNTDSSDNSENEGAENTGADRRPIGYWLRTVDAYITREFARAFDDEGVSRREWMLLNVVSGDVDAPGFAERLARKGKRLRGLEQRGWALEAGDGTWTLTEEGRAAKERLGAIVDGIRTRVAGAVSPEDFATTIASLEAIARELGWDENARGPWAGFGGRVGRGFRPGFGRGFGEGFGPRGFAPDMRHGFGSGARHGFGPGRGFGEGFDSDAMHDHGDHPHHHRGHDHQGHRSDHGDCHGHGGRGHARPGHEGRGHGHGRHGHDAEHAYERGFDAGYTRGQSAS